MEVELRRKGLFDDSGNDVWVRQFLVGTVDLIVQFNSGWVRQ